MPRAVVTVDPPLPFPNPCLSTRAFPPVLFHPCYATRAGPRQMEASGALAPIGGATALAAAVKLVQSAPHLSAPEGETRPKKGGFMGGMFASKKKEAAAPVEAPESPQKPKRRSIFGR